MREVISFVEGQWRPRNTLRLRWSGAARRLLPYLTTPDSLPPHGDEELEVT
ncbi:MAG: hypothetical protein IPM82_28380 [Saprospiraceae bacterium]|nr:hypothetical protein [Saprospiraceae bacterium]